MAEEKKFNIQESRIFSVKRDDEQVIKFPIDTKWVEQINTLPFFIVEKEDGEFNLFELTDDNQLFAIILHCTKIIQPSKTTSHNRFYIKCSKQDYNFIWDLRNNCKLPAKIRGDIRLDEIINDYIPVDVSITNARIMNIRTGEYVSDCYYYINQSHSDAEYLMPFFELRSRNYQLAGLFDTQTGYEIKERQRHRLRKNKERNLECISEELEQLLDEY